MISLRPFTSSEEVFEQADSVWWSLAQSDWREAFTHHPKIGDFENLRKKFATTASWATNEQLGAADASEETLNALADGNTHYEETFGYIFIVCATGKSAEEMLQILKSRLPNSPATEITIAAGEQAKITRLRLEKLLDMK
jgi:2-oxo-4-hydroxy-4-carboxy-5-ureidoimidazoline decarboxylase